MDHSRLRSSQVLRRRDLISEGRALLGAVLGGGAPCGAVRRYVRGVERYDGGLPLHLPMLAYRWPAAFEPVGGASSPFSRRLALAMRVVEATPQGNGTTHGVHAIGVVRAMARLAAVGLRELLLLPLRLVLGHRR